MSATPAASRSNDDDEPCDSVDQARMDFNRRFDRDAFPARLDSTGTERRGRVFDRSVKRAIEKLGHCWIPGDEKMTDFALTRVGDIAILCRYRVGDGKITGDIVDAATKTVVDYWRPRCNQFIFCVGFDSDE